MLSMFVCAVTIRVSWRVSYKRQALLIIRMHQGSPPGFCVAHLVSFLSCVIWFVCLRVGSCVPNVGSVFELSILGFLLGFLQGVTNPSKLICSPNSYLCLLSRETANTSCFVFRCIRTMIGQSHCYTTTAIMIGKSHCYTTTAIMIGQSHCYSTTAIKVW